MPHYFDIALPLPLRKNFTYSVNSLASSIGPGLRVRVPFKGRTLIGIVASQELEAPSYANRVKEIDEILDETPALPEELIRLCHWASTYYQHPLGEVLNAALPQRLREGKSAQVKPLTEYIHTLEGKGLPHDGLRRAPKQQQVHQYLLEHGSLHKDKLKQLEISPGAIKALVDKQLITQQDIAPPEPGTSNVEQLLAETPKTLNKEQSVAVEAIRYHEFGCHLLEGATGSGKTEVYLHIIARVLRAGKQAMLLIPEIGLSGQTVERLRNRFNVEIAELHSNVSEGERGNSWLSAASGQAKIVVGTRLASLTPFQSLGAIIIDEEHDRSYKQQDGFKYSARDVSIYRASQLNIPIILGTATPSLESLNNARQTKYQHLYLHKRAGDAKPPTFEVVDLRNQKLSSGLSERALTAISTTVDQGEQALVFINRRGYAPALVCHSCGWSADCLACDSSMTLHTKPRHLRCHHCDRSRSVPRACGHCKSPDLKPAGFGTEQIEHMLQEVFATSEIVRIDSDATRSKKRLESKLQHARSGSSCIMVGTQMLAKGHHFPNLTLVVVVDADQGLISPDFRALEQMGQSITQVAGRAGREEKPGRVIIQTHRPEHPLLQTLLCQGYQHFALELLAQRHQSNLPPYWHLVLFKAESKHAEVCVNLLQQMREIIQQLIPTNSQALLLGPLPANLEKINDRYRFCLQLSSPQRKLLSQLLPLALTQIDQLALSKRARWSIDVDSLEN